MNLLEEDTKDRELENKCKYLWMLRERDFSIFCTLGGLESRRAKDFDFYSKSCGESNGRFSFQ